MTQTTTQIRNYGLIFLMVLSLLGVSSAQTSSTPKPEEAFDAVASVLTHPRCLNCHQAQAPKQTDMGVRHTQGVVRGKDGKGAVGLSCNSCHQGGNSVDGRVPGAKHWQLAPLTMNWEGLSKADLCRQMKDPKRNGNRSGAQIVEHVATEPLVLWSWKPGAKRTVPPLSHADFVAAVRMWADQGLPCPS